MARTTTVRLVDDIDGSEADGTILFQLGGTAYEIDLSSANATRLRETLAPFVAAARRAGSTSSPGPLRRPSTRPAADRARTRAIREWALSQGLTVSARGRLSDEIVTAYDNRQDADAPEPPQASSAAERPAVEPPVFSSAG